MFTNSSQSLTRGSNQLGTMPYEAKVISWNIPGGSKEFNLKIQLVKILIPT